MSTTSTRHKIGLILGILTFVCMMLVPAPEGLSLAGLRVGAVALLMAIWWISEVMPLAATALLPILLFPLLGIASLKDTTAPYANSIIFLFMGGFLIALAMEKWLLHKRIALNIIKRTGTSPKALILGFMISTAFLSMWISNTATTLMMLPIALSVVHLLYADGATPEENKFVVALLLGIAYAASIGGLGTIIGTPPNAILAGFLDETYGFTLSFGTWMAAGIPFVMVGLPLAYFLLTRVIFRITLENNPGTEKLFEDELKKLGGWSEGEKWVGLIFCLVAVGWIFNSISAPLFGLTIDGLSDTNIAIGGALLLFIIPIRQKKERFVLDWETAKKVPWGLLLLFGGGLTLADAIKNTGLADWIGTAATSISGLSPIVILLVVVALIVFLTEITSNTATAATFLPILAPVAISLGQNPLFLVIPAALAASCAFMLPVATPPNAIIYGSNQLEIKDMYKAGLWLNFLFIFLITGFVYTLFLYLFDIQLDVIPTWAQ